MNPAQTPLGTILGSDYGGHAPLVGAHVYVLQPSVTTATGTSQTSSESNAYAGQATSLLTATYSSNGSNNPKTVQNTSDPGIPTSWYYLQTDLTGAFNITGDYTCTAGVPVYLYLYGGSPIYPSANNTFNISTFNITGTSGNYTINFTINTTSGNTVENAYLGEGYTISANGSANPAGHYPFDTSFQTVIASGLTTTTFSSSLGSTTTAQLTNGGLAANTSYPQTGSNMTVTFQPTFNSAVVNLAVLGNCPNNGTLAGTGTFSGSSAISYVFVNEVSTVAAAYAFRPFTFTTLSGAQGYQTDCTSTYNGTTYDWANATCIGTSSKNLAGLQNAALIAAQLYDITGSNLSTTYAGEGHIARSTTTAGNGIVPQANIDTLGNILAACVDSNNGSTTVVTGTPGYGGGTNGVNSNISAQCNTLFTYATSNGVPTTASSGAGIQPFDTATAALNIARHPAGPPYSYSTTGSSTFMTQLYTLPTGNPPFSPSLASTGAGQPNDFTIGIDYTSANNPATGSNPYAYTIGAESLAVDKIGNVWVTTQPSPGSFQGYLEEFSPVGVISNVAYQTNHIYGYVTIDSGESPWAGSATSVGFYTYQHATSTPSDTSGSVPQSYTYASSAQTSSGSYTYAAVSDASGNVYFTSNIANGDSTDYIVKFAGGATTPTVTPTTTTNALTNVNSHTNGMSHGAIDSTGAAYFDYNASGSNNGTPSVTRNTLSTAAQTSTAWPVTNSTSGCTSLTDPEHLAVMRSGDVLVVDYNNGGGGLNAASSSAYYITSAGVCTQISGASMEAGFNSPFGVAVDGNDYVYLTNRGGSSISVVNAQGGTAATIAAVSPSNGYEPQYVSGSTLTPMLSGPLNVAIDPSGNAWVTDYGNNSVVEIIGLAYPATTPLSVAAIPAPYNAGSIGFRP